MDTGLRIRKERIAKGWTQKGLADKAGVSLAVLQQYEYHKRQPTVAQLLKIAAALAVDVRSLIGGGAPEHAANAAAYHVERTISLLGFTEDFDEDNAMVWLTDTHTGKHCELVVGDIESVKREVLSFITFKLRELIDRNNAIPAVERGERNAET